MCVCVCVCVCVRVIFYSPNICLLKYSLLAI